ncbi:MAG: hypothetical protein JO030_01075 [Candidatus Eremiobacteraeota bacterium]|nr:hypothetical protein [Candidatus Eremiobacteraeota bacterium]
MVWAHRIRAAVCAGIAAWPLGCAANDRQTYDAVDMVRAAFDRHAVVALGRAEGTGNETEFRLIARLLGDRRLRGRINDVVIECGNSRYQPLLDRYVFGGTVSRRQVQVVWRKTTQIFGCEADRTTQMLVDFVRRLNDKKKQPRLRLLAADPPIEWAAIHSRAQFDSFLSRRDESAANVIETQVLRKQRRALVIIGGAHLTRRPSVGSGTTITMLLERKQPDATYVVYDVEDWSPFSKDIRALVASWKSPAIVPVAGTALGRQGGETITAGDTMLKVGSKWLSVKNEYPGNTLAQLFDAVLYLGPAQRLRTVELKEPTDQPYARELQRIRSLAMGSAPEASVKRP